MFSEDSLLYSSSLNYYAENFVLHFDEINNSGLGICEEEDNLSPKLSIDIIERSYIKEKIPSIKKDDYNKNSQLCENQINSNSIEKNIIKNKNNEDIKNSKEEKIENEENKNSTSITFSLNLKQNEKNDVSETFMVELSNSKIPSLSYNLEKRKNNIFKTDKNKGKYHILTKEEKIKIYKDLKYMSNSEVSKKYNVSLRNVTRWKKEGIERKKGSGRKYKDPLLEKKLLIWFLKKVNKEKITTKMFRNKAKELSCDSSFKASTGWLVRIQKKYNLEFAKY